MDIKKREDEIFGEYASHCEQCSAHKALPDGCPDSTRFLKADYRVLFALKEAHGWDKETDRPRDLRQFARDGGAYKTWGNLSRWAALIDNPQFVDSDLNASISEERAKKLAPCCFVNLKKIPGETKSNYNEISVFAKRHSDLIKAQLALYKPHVTITCGTFDILREIYGATAQDKPEIDHGFKFFKSIELGTVIDFYHPQYFRISSTDYLKMLRSNLSFHFPDRFNKLTHEKSKNSL